MSSSSSSGCSGTAASGACASSTRYSQRPDGLPQALVIAQEFLGGGPSCLVLGRQHFLWPGVHAHAATAPTRPWAARPSSATPSRIPPRFGVVEFDGNERVPALEEKPAKPKSNLAVTGLYFFDERAPEFAAGLKPSPRGETEIIELLRRYLDDGALHFQRLGSRLRLAGHRDT